MATQTDTLDKKRAPLSRRRILEVAMRIVDSEGLDALSMRRVAAELDATPMALYNHVPNKEALLLGLARRLLEEMDLSQIPLEDPAEALRFGYGEYRKLLLAHPNLIPCVQLKGDVSVEGMRPIELALSLLQRLGFSPEDALRAHWALTGLTMGHVAWQLSSPLFDEGGAAAHILDHRRTLPPGEFPCLLAAIPALEANDMDAAFEFGIDALIRGFQAIIASNE
jgi:TetR/AcrR family tetracycline transcriptional repressor